VSLYRSNQSRHGMRFVRTAGVFAFAVAATASAPCAQSTAPAADRGVMSALTTSAAAEMQSPADVKVTFDWNPRGVIGFTFPHVAAPIKDDLAAKGTWTIVDGEADPNGLPTSALSDGFLPNDEDQPGMNFFFNAGTPGGTLRLDLGAAHAIAAVRSYSWHANTRGPQVYTLFASEGSAAAFNASPKGVDPATAGWTRIADVDTRPKSGDGGGQYGVSITRSGAALGTFRYLLFVCLTTENDDDWGNTFFSEIDVIGTGSPSASRR